MDVLWPYFLVFLLAATPWIELLVVIPGALAAGLEPHWVAVLAFAGNAWPVVALVYGYELLRARLKSRLHSNSKLQSR